MLCLCPPFRCSFAFESAYRADTSIRITETKQMIDESACQGFDTLKWWLGASCMLAVICLIIRPEIEDLNSAKASDSRASCRKPC